VINDTVDHLAGEYRAGIQLELFVRYDNIITLKASCKAIGYTLPSLEATNKVAPYEWYHIVLAGTYRKRQPKKRRIWSRDSADISIVSFHLISAIVRDLERSPWGVQCYRW